MIVCFDLETTGLDKYNDKIIEIAMVKIDDKTFEIIEKYSCFVDPWVEIPELISNITNIFDDDVVWAPKIEDLRVEILDFIWDSVLLWHNVNFDIDFFVNNGIDISKNLKIDTFFLANILTFNNDSLNLEMLCNHYNIEFEWAHRAINDVNATIELFKNQILDFHDMSSFNKKLLYYIFNLSSEENVKFLKKYLFWEYDLKINLEFFENELLKKIQAIDLTKEISTNESIDDSDIEKYFEFWNDVEKRENQLQMTKEVYNTYKNKKKTVIEAPTGLWKSYAYLIPSIIHSLKTWEKVYITTKTKNLQDQLYDRDLKFLSKNIWYDFNYSKLKWRKNYISLKSYFDSIFLWDLSYTEVNMYSKICLWLLETKYWELDELTFYPDEFFYLRNLNCEGYVNISEKNPYRDYEFIYKARKWVEKSNIVVINHSLLYSDLASESKLLPNLKNLVIDEAHSIEDSVTDSLKQRFSLFTIKDHFVNLEKIFKQKNIKKIELLNIKESLIQSLEILDDSAFWYLDSKIPSDQWFKVLLLKDDFFEELDFWNILKKINLYLIDIIDILKTKEEYDFSKEINFFESLANNINNYFDKNSSNTFIKILSYNDRFGINFEYTLLNPADYLDQNLRKKLDSCILTSATLSIWDSFDYVKNILKLDEFDFLSFYSDFDYSKQATLFIPTDIGSIKNNTNTVIDFLYKFYSIVRGNTLTLLTSFNIIKKIYTSCNIELKKNWINLYAQSIWWSKTKLLSNFTKSSHNSILLWTDSFWEWVDIPWEDLKYLIIHKFPFQVPTDPIFQARSVFFKDPFKEYSIPKAIIKLKQWFWRLIRTKNDKWVVILLDDRINTNWWSEFYNAFPDNINIKKWTKDTFLKILEKNW